MHRSPLLAARVRCAQLRLRLAEVGIAVGETEETDLDLAGTLAEIERRRQMLRLRGIATAAIHGAAEDDDGFTVAHAVEDDAVAHEEQRAKDKRLMGVAAALGAATLLGLAILAVFVDRQQAAAAKAYQRTRGWAPVRIKEASPGLGVEPGEECWVQADDAGREDPRHAGEPDACVVSLECKKARSSFGLPTCLMGPSELVLKTPGLDIDTTTHRGSVTFYDGAHRPRGSVTLVVGDLR